MINNSDFLKGVSTHSRPKAAGSVLRSSRETVSLFQHTAARRRLVYFADLLTRYRDVSTHSRPKAAGLSIAFLIAVLSGFNTQPPEGGWGG